MNRIREPFFLLAGLCILAIVLVEIGSIQAADVANHLPPFLLGRGPTPLEQMTSFFPPEQQAELDRLLGQTTPAEINRLRRGGPQGFGVRSLVFVDGLLVFTTALIALMIFLPRVFSRYEYFHARFQGIATLIFNIVLILAAIPALLIVIGKLILMIALLLSFPFGTLAYLIIFGSFPRGSMSAVLSLIFLLKLLFGGLLLLAHQDFIKNLFLVIYILAALAANLVVTFLYGIVPGILVSITDAIAAIVVIVIGIVLAVIMAIGAVISILATLKPV